MTFIFISAMIINLLEMLTFFLVIKLMLPITPAEKENKSQFRNFLFNGFADID